MFITFYSVCSWFSICTNVSKAAWICVLLQASTLGCLLWVTVANVESCEATWCLWCGCGCAQASPLSSPGQGDDTLWRVWEGILEQFTCLAIHIHSLDFVSGIWMLGNLHLQIKHTAENLVHHASLQRSVPWFFWFSAPLVPFLTLNCDTAFSHLRDATDWNNIVLATFRQFEACHKIQWIAAMSRTDSVVNGAVCNIIQWEQHTCVESLPGVEDAVKQGQGRCSLSSPSIIGYFNRWHL